LFLTWRKYTKALYEFGPSYTDSYREPEMKFSLV
jgi:hypothetical protein